MEALTPHLNRKHRCR